MSNATDKVVLKASNFQELARIPFLRETLVLSHIMNTLRSSQRFLLLTVTVPDSPTKTRDTIFGILSTVSFVYAGIERAAGILSELAGSLPRMRNEIAWVINEQRQADSLFNTTLKKVRDQIVFHFGLQIGDDVLNKSVKKYPPIFAEGSSNRTMDWSYTLSDDVITQLLAVYDPSPGEPDVKVNNLLQQLSEYNNKLSLVLDGVIAELVVNNANALLGQNGA